MVGTKGESPVRNEDQERSSDKRAEFGTNRTNPAAYCLHIGIAAGVIWGLLRWLAVAMHLTKVPQAFLIDPWVKRSVLTYGYWQVIGFAAFILMSIAAAYLYYGLLRPFRGPLPGLLFGLAWWTAFYAALGPLVGAVPPLGGIGWNSLLTDLCVFSVWGLFIGYSIAFEFHQEAGREPGTSGREAEPSPT